MLSVNMVEALIIVGIVNSYIDLVVKVREDVVKAIAKMESGIFVGINVRDIGGVNPLGLFKLREIQEGHVLVYALEVIKVKNVDYEVYENSLLVTPHVAIV